MNFLKLLFCIIPVVMVQLPVMAEEIIVGAAVPDVTQKTDTGETLNLGKVASSGYTLVYFYPKADTPGCTKQACSLRDAYEQLGKKGVKVIGVSADTVEKQAAFKAKFNLPFTLLADKDKTVINAFGVPLRGKGFASRQAYLFKDGKLVWRDLKASTSEQAADVLAVVNQ